MNTKTQRPSNGSASSGRRSRVAVCVVVLSVFVSESQTLVFPPSAHSYGIRKATPAHLFLFFGPLTRFSDPQGLATTLLVSRDDPSTEADDDEVVVYGVNAGHHEIIYNTSMWGLARYGSRGHGKGEFFHPRGVAADPHGNVFVADSGNNRLVHLFNPRRTVQWVRSYTGSGGDGLPLKGPTQVAVDADGLVYVSDAGNKRIVVVDTNDSMVRSIIPRTGGFENGPTTLVVADGRQDWSYFGTDRNLFCADRDGRRLWKFSLRGETEASRSMPRGFQAGYAAVDFYHNVWITDRRHHCVLKFDRELNLLDTFGTYGKGDNQFIEPRGIAIWKRYGQTFIAEKSGAQYYWIGTECTARELKHSDGGGYRLSVTVTEYSFVTLFIVDSGDTTTWLERQMVAPGSTSLSVDGERELTPRERTEVVLRVEPTYSSRTFYHWDYPVRID